MTDRFCLLYGQSLRLDTVMVASVGSHDWEMDGPKKQETSLIIVCYIAVHSG